MSTTSTTNDGGPAFPRPHNLTGNIQPGMSLRDWFAGQALASMAGLARWNHAEVVAEAYRIADAMLAKREKPQAPAGPEVAP